MTYFDQISGQNKSEARELEGVVKITYGIVASSLFKSWKFKFIGINFEFWGYNLGRSGQNKSWVFVSGGGRCNSFKYLV